MAIHLCSRNRFVHPHPEKRECIPDTVHSKCTTSHNNNVLKIPKWAKTLDTNIHATMVEKETPMLKARETTRLAKTAEVEKAKESLGRSDMELRGNEYPSFCGYFSLGNCVGCNEPEPRFQIPFHII
jgi:hypothetical protein